MRCFRLFSPRSVWPPPTAQNRSSVPAPESVFGFNAGADYKLATYDQSIEYFKRLAAASRYQAVRRRQDDAGPEMYFALISSPDNLAKIDQYREIGSAWRIRRD